MFESRRLPAMPPLVSTPPAPGRADGTRRHSPGDNDAMPVAFRFRARGKPRHRLDDACEVTVAQLAKFAEATSSVVDSTRQSSL